MAIKRFLPLLLCLFLLGSCTDNKSALVIYFQNNSDFCITFTDSNGFVKQTLPAGESITISATKEGSAALDFSALWEQNSIAFIQLGDVLRISTDYYTSTEIFDLCNATSRYHYTFTAADYQNAFNNGTILKKAFTDPL